MQKRDPKPEIQRLEELALSVKYGDIKLPKFQRPFVWRRPDILKLLDSIYKGYPIGSLLMWNSSQPLTSERSISGLKLNQGEHTNYPTNYLLDGQQRLTTLCGALFWDGDDPTSIWNIHFDMESEEFVYPKEFGIHLFPLNKLIGTSDFIRQCMKFEPLEKGPDYTRKAERLLRALKDYKIAVVKIGDMTVEEVAPIFERINSTGRKLTMVDLMMAATWSDDFDLNSAIQEISIAAKDAGFSEVRGQVILRSIAAAAGFGINKDDIQRLRRLNSDELQCAVRQARSAVVLAVDFLQRRLNIFDFGRIPYGLQFTHVVEYFRIAQQHDTTREDELARWVWFTSVTRYFTSANSGQNSDDLALIRSFGTHGRSSLYERKQIDISRLLFDRFNLRNSTSTTFTALLGSQLPYQSLDGRPIDQSYLSVKNSKLYRSLLPAQNRFSGLNIAKVIHPFPKEPRSLEAAHFEAHLLNEDCVSRLEANSFDAFVSQRAYLVASMITSITGCPTEWDVTHLLESDEDELTEWWESSVDEDEWGEAQQA